MHADSRKCVMGKFTVKENLPAHLAQGLLAKPGQYNMIIVILLLLLNWSLIMLRLQGDWNEKKLERRWRSCGERI